MMKLRRAGGTKRQKLSASSSGTPAETGGGAVRLSCNTVGNGLLFFK